MLETTMIGTWWGYADGDSMIVGTVVVVMVIAALAHVLRRYLEHRRRR
jgi:hypothetical protein